MNTENILYNFILWSEQNLPKSYRKYYKNDRRNNFKKFKMLESEYRESFGTSPFDVNMADEKTIDEHIERIKKNCTLRTTIENKSFEAYNKKSQNGIPNAVLNKHFIIYLNEKKEEKITPLDSVTLSK